MHILRVAKKRTELTVRNRTYFYRSDSVITGSSRASYFCTGIARVEIQIRIDITDEHLTAEMTEHTKISIANAVMTVESYLGSKTSESRFFINARERTLNVKNGADCMTHSW